MLFFSSLKKFTIHAIIGANVASILVMLLVGYSDRLNPAEHPVLSSVGLVFPFLLVVNVAFLLFWLLVKPRVAVIPVLGLIINYVPVRTYCPINFSREVPDSALKVLSYNVKMFEVNEKVEDMHATLHYVLNSNADIVCLQEARMRNRWNQALYDAYPYHDELIYGGMSHVIMSRYPIVGKERIPYPTHANGTAAFYLTIGGERVLVISNHFETNGLSVSEKPEIQEMAKGKTSGDTLRQESRRLIVKLGNAASKRVPQADAVARYISEHQDMPIIVCGDFYENPISYVRHRIARDLTDCYIESGSGPGWTYNHGSMKVRIDNIMCNDRFVPCRCEVDSKIAASDHYPIICWLKMQHK